MITKCLTVTNKLGLHARAAAKLVKLTTSFQSTITLAHAQNGKAVDAKSIMEVMLLAASPGSDLTLCVQGADATPATAAVCQLFADCFGEGE